MARQAAEIAKRTALANGQKRSRFGSSTRPTGASLAHQNEGWASFNTRVPDELAGANLFANGAKIIHSFAKLCQLTKNRRPLVGARKLAPTTAQSCAPKPARLAPLLTHDE